MSDPTEKRLATEYVIVPTVPIIYFDFAPTYGTLGGIIQIELAVRTLQPLQDGGVNMASVETARLRCGPIAARFLKDALEGALKMLEQPQMSPVAVGKLN
jgi:hypothetical protein